MRAQSRKIQAGNITDTAEAATAEVTELSQEEVDLEELNACLRVCNMGAKAETFAAAYGATYITNLSEVTIVQAKALTKIFNYQQTRTNRLVKVVHQLTCSTNLLGTELHSPPITYPAE